MLEMRDGCRAVGGVVPGVPAVVAAREMPARWPEKTEQFLVAFAHHHDGGAGRDERRKLLPHVAKHLLVAEKIVDLLVVQFELRDGGVKRLGRLLDRCAQLLETGRLRRE